jgi:hypothetical protein
MCIVGRKISWCGVLAIALRVLGFYYRHQYLVQVPYRTVPGIEVSNHVGDGRRIGRRRTSRVLSAVAHPRCNHFARPPLRRRQELATLARAFITWVLHSAVYVCAPPATARVHSPPLLWADVQLFSRDSRQKQNTTASN